MKKILFSFTAIIMSIIMVGTQVFVFSETRQLEVSDNTDNNSAIEKLKTLGLLDKNQPDIKKELSRSVAVTMVLKTLGYTDNVSGNLEYQRLNPFVDVPDWFKAYAGLAFSKKITLGISKNEFNPNAKVSSKEFMTFMLRTMGYDLQQAWSDTERVAKMANINGLNISNEIITKEVAAELVLKSLDGNLKSGRKLIDKIKENTKKDENVNINKTEKSNISNRRGGGNSSGTNKPINPGAKGDYIVKDSIRYKINDDGTLTLSRFTPNLNENKVTIPESVDGRKVSAIGVIAFQDIRDLQEVRFAPNSEIKLIDDHAFANCESLKGCLKLPETVEEIGEKAFNGCSNLEEIIIPKKIRKLKWHVFRNCTSMKKLVFMANKPPEEMSNVKDWETFYDFNVNTIIEIPMEADLDEYKVAFERAGLAKSVQIIKKGDEIKNISFENLADGTLEIKSLNVKDKNVTIPSEYNGKKITVLGDSLFKDNKTLEEVTLPKELKKIGKEVFSGCVNLKNIEVPASVEEICRAAFSNTKKLKSITFSGKIPPKFEKFSMSGGSNEMVINIDENASWFDYLKKLQDANLKPEVQVKYKNKADSDFRFKALEDGVSVYRYMDFNVKRLTIPDTFNGTSIKTIEDSPFARNKDLEEVILPKMITRIGNAAFEGKNKLKTITIPESVEIMGDKIFKNCSFVSAEGRGIVIKFESKKAPEFEKPLGELGPDWTEIIPEPSAFFGLNEKAEIILPSDITDEEKTEFVETLKKQGLSDKVLVKKNIDMND